VCVLHHDDLLRRIDTVGRKFPDRGDPFESSVGRIRVCIHPLAFAMKTFSNDVFLRALACQMNGQQPASMLLRTQPICYSESPRADLLNSGEQNDVLEVIPYGNGYMVDVCHI
jgi:hypothetical protein